MEKGSVKNIHIQAPGCKRCGECCRNGGPALHHEDLHIIRKGHIRHKDLLCIREGEPSWNPLRAGVTPADQEYVKVTGKETQWECCFFSAEESACRIHTTRPLECRLLECWAPEKLIPHIGCGIVKRADLINPRDPVHEFISLQENVCSFHETGELLSELRQEKTQPDILESLARLVQNDLRIRQEAFTLGGVAPEHEYFLFGRPLFVSLKALGVESIEHGGRILCHYRPPK